MMSKQEEIITVEWEGEFRKTALKYHVIVAWVAVVLNPVWALADYLTIPEHFNDFLVFRIAVCVLTLICIFFKNRLENYPELFAFIPFAGISIQNAYMYSVMDVGEIQKHTFAYIALFIGAGMFVLWKIQYSIYVVLLSFAANIIFFSVNGKLNIEQIMVNGGLLTATVALFTIILIFTRTRLTKRELIARLMMEKVIAQFREKNEIIEMQNNDIKASLTYAQRIQHAILPPNEKIEKVFEDYFIFYEPKDIISGDFYWFSSVRTTPEEGESEEIIVIAAVDCTGHGVPGALMSIMGNAILNQSLTQKGVNSPAEALGFLNGQLVKNLNSINDGMDVCFCAINRRTLALQYAGANNPLYIIRNGELIEFKADKKAIGADHSDAEQKTFTNNHFQLQPGDAIYMFSDGYADQFGGPESFRGGKKFKYNRFKSLLLESQDKSMAEQRKILIENYNAWKGELEQVDDILILGLKI